MKLTHSYCMGIISKTFPLPCLPMASVCCILRSLRLFFFLNYNSDKVFTDFSFTCQLLCKSANLAGKKKCTRMRLQTANRTPSVLFIGLLLCPVIVCCPPRTSYSTGKKNSVILKDLKRKKRKRTHTKKKIYEKGVREKIGE